MRFFFAFTAALGLICVTLDAQQPQGGLVRHQSGVATVVANDPRPLDQAIAAVREEYGWVVDYEDPPYQSSRVVADMSPAEWHATHPGKVGFLMPTGGAFQSTYPETPNMWSPTGMEQQVLEKIVSDYNQSGNPGKFAVRGQSDGSYVVQAVQIEDDQGSEVPVSPILDTLVTIPSATRDALTTLDMILDAISAKSGIRCRGGGPFNLLHQSQVTVGGENVPARNVLMALIAAIGMRMSWDMWFEPNMHEYHLWIAPTARADTTTFGQRRLVPVSPIPRPPKSP